MTKSLNNWPIVRYIKSNWDTFEQNVGFILMPFFFYAILRLILIAAAYIHWILGVVLSIAALLGLGLLVYVYWRKKKEVVKKFPLRLLFSILASIILMAACAMSALSFFFYEAGFVHYYANNPISPGSLSDFYLWHFADSIPVIDLWSYFEVDSPVEADGFFAASLLLAFRLAYLIPCIWLFKDWLALSKKSTDAVREMTEP